jgi:SAM-dependent methyltransferase
MRPEQEPIYGKTNIKKYEEKNPITSGLVRRFMGQCIDVLDGQTQKGASILDVGVSEGTMTRFIVDNLPDRLVISCEYEPEGCAAFHRAHADLPLTRTSVYALPFPTGSFDVVTAFEVLEHLADPRGALLEMKRVSRGPVTVTVPYEPFFRMGNVARGKHLSALGNTPGHINHWRARTLESLMVSTFPSVKVVRLFPWLLATGEDGSSAGR